MRLEKVKIRRGIFQADSLPPLLFVMYTTADPLLRELNKGYIIGNTMINHQLFMDDLELFGKSESQVESLLNTVQGHPTTIFGKYLFGRRFEI